MKKIFLFLIVLIIIVVSVTIYYLQRNIYSKEVLKLDILGPEEIEAGQEIEYSVRYKNNGDVVLEELRFIFEYPSNTMLGEDEQLRKEIELENIYPGEEKTMVFKARFLGKEGDLLKVKAWLSYSPKNLSARYESKTSLTSTIKSVPLTFKFDLPSSVQTGKDISFRINYFSNINYPLSNLRVKVEYPQGFEFKESFPRGLDKDEWELGGLNKAEGGRVEITGIFDGSIGSQKILKAKLGVWHNNRFIVLKEINKGVELIQLSLYISQQVNGSLDYIASPGDFLHYQIFFKNLGEEPLTNLFMVVKLEGELIDFDSLRTEGGIFQKGDNSILFDWNDFPLLAFLDSQEEEELEFWIQLKEDAVLKGKDNNPEIKSKILIKQSREEFSIKVNSKIAIDQKGFYQDEVFGNSGPVPPEVGKETTYTIKWSVKNYYNDLGDVKARAILPSNVSLTGQFFPSNEITFDSESREIVWQVGDVPAKAGLEEEGPNIAFQVRLNPLDSQRGKNAVLVKEVSLKAKDKWTDSFLETKDKEIDSSLPDDSSSGGVVK